MTSASGIGLLQGRGDHRFGARRQAVTRSMRAIWCQCQPCQIAETRAKLGPRSTAMTFIHGLMLGCPSAPAAGGRAGVWVRSASFVDSLFVYRIHLIRGRASTLGAGLASGIDRQSQATQDRTTSSHAGDDQQCRGPNHGKAGIHHKAADGPTAQNTCQATQRSLRKPQQGRRANRKLGRMLCGARLRAFSARRTS